MLSLFKLSALAVARASQPGYVGDGGGLVLQVSQSGSKSWLFRYRVNGKHREMGLGSLLAVDLAAARVKAKHCRDQLSEGIDPLESRQHARVADRLARARQISFDQCASAYIAAHRGGWRNPKHATQWINTLATYVSPVMGSLPVAAVDTDLIVKALAGIWLDKTETATRIRGRIECILDWATVSGFRKGDNPARWNGHLDQLLANPNKISPVKNYAALPWTDIPRLMRVLELKEGVAAVALRFLILTAARSGEVRGARWDELDMEKGVWTVPASRMKARREHRVPLSDPARALIGKLTRRDGPVFSGRKSGAQLSDATLASVLKRIGHGDVTVHGFRSAFRDWCAEAVGNDFSREVCEHALAHQLPDRVEAAYQRGDLFDKRIALMRAWADFCAGR